MGRAGRDPTDVVRGFEQLRTPRDAAERRVSFEKREETLGGMNVRTQYSGSMPCTGSLPRRRLEMS